MTADPYKALREQANTLKRHDQERDEIISTRNNLIRQLNADGYPKRRIAIEAGLSRETVYQILKEPP